MQRALISFPETDLAALDRLSGQQRVSRSELIRQAVAMYLEKFKAADKPDEAFGLWKHKAEDGLAYQQRLRQEW